MKAKKKDNYRYYSYRIVWAEEDGVFLGRCLELPSLVAHGATEEAALKEIKTVVNATVKWMKEEGEQLPEPITVKNYRPNFPLRRIPLELRRALEIEAKEENTSVNTVILRKLKQTC